MMQEKTEQNWTQADSAPGASQDQAALGGDKGTDAAKEAAGPRGTEPMAAPIPGAERMAGHKTKGPRRNRCIARPSCKGSWTA